MRRGAPAPRRGRFSTRGPSAMVPQDSSWSLVVRRALASNPVLFVVVASCLVAIVTFGARSGFGLYLEPVTTSRGFGREIFALAIGIQNIVWGVGQPVTGALADRFGTTRVLVGGALLYALGMTLTAFADTPLELHLSAGLLVGIGGSGASFGIVMAAASRLVPAWVEELLG